MAPKECSHEWDELDEAYALTIVTKDGGKSIFNPNYGIPLVVHICKKCGKVKLYSAVVQEKFGWKKR